MKTTYQNRSCFVGAFLGIALVAGLICLPGTALGWVDMSRVSHVGDTWYVTPSYDVERDRDTVQYAVDNAQSGETILLKRGIFDFGVMDPTDFYAGSGIDVSAAAENLTIKGETYNFRCGREKGEVMFWMTMIRGGGGSIGAIQVADSKHTTVEGLWLYEPFRWGIFVGGVNPKPAEGGVVIRNNRVTNVREIIVADEEWGAGEIFSAAVVWWGVWSGTYTIEGNLIEDNWWYQPTQVGPFDTTRDMDVDWLGNRNGFFFKYGRGSLDLRNNKVRHLEGNGVQIWSGGTGICTIEGNDIRLSASEFSRYSGLEIQCYHDIAILNNKIKTDRGFSGNGITVAGFRWLVPPSCVVTGNSIKMGSGIAGIQMGIVDNFFSSPLVGAEISDNSIKGSALYGLLVEHGDPNLRTEFNTVAIEKLRNFNAQEAHIYCGPLSENNTFLVENLDDVTVVDDGVDNVFEDLD